VLFVDFARPLYPPFHWLNERIVNLARSRRFARSRAKTETLAGHVLEKKAT